MRSTASVTAFVACVATAASAFAAPTTSARLRIADRDPLTVRGYGFDARERVRVVALVADARDDAPATTVRRFVRSDRTGSFRAVFSEVELHRCDTVRVTAIGDGDRAVLKILAPPLCRADRTP